MQSRSTDRRLTVDRVLDISPSCFAAVVLLFNLLDTTVRNCQALNHTLPQKLPWLNDGFKYGSTMVNYGKTVRRFRGKRS